MTNILLEKEMKKYIRATKRFLDCPKNYRDMFIQEMEHDLTQFIQENDSVEMADIINYFGTPQELARTYLDCVPEKDMRDYALKKKFYSNITKIIIGVTILSTVIILSLIIYKAHELEQMHIYESIKTIEENIE